MSQMKRFLEKVELDPEQYGYKKCSQCLTHQPDTKFYKNRTNKDGLDHLCKDCRKGKNEGYYKDNTDKVKHRIYAARSSRPN